MSLKSGIAAESKLAELEKQETYAWVFEKSACRAPDDCEDYLEIIELEKVNKDELDKYLKHDRAFPLFMNAKPSEPLQRITEQDVREMVKAAFIDIYLMPISDERIDRWVKSEAGTLLAKLNEHREPEVKAEVSKPDFYAYVCNELPEKYHVWREKAEAGPVIGWTEFGLYKGLPSASSCELNRDWFEKLQRDLGAQDDDLVFEHGEYSFSPIQKQWAFFMLGQQMPVAANKEEVPEYVYEFVDVIKNLMNWQVKHVDAFDNYAYNDAARLLAKLPPIPPLKDRSQ